MTFRQKKLCVYIPILLLLGLQTALSFYKPSQMVLQSIDINKLGFVGSLTNPIFLLIFCYSFILMLLMLVSFASTYHRREQGLRMLLLIVVFLGLSLYILYGNLAYIKVHMVPFISVAVYEAFNPTATTDYHPYAYEFSLYPATLIMWLWLLPLFVPLLVRIAALFKRIKELKRQMNQD